MVAAEMTALMPGAGPPPTRIASVFTMPSADPSYAKDATVANKHRGDRLPGHRAPASAPAPSRATRSARRLDHVADSLAQPQGPGDRQRQLEQQLEHAAAE